MPPKKNAKAATAKDKQDKKKTTSVSKAKSPEPKKADKSKGKKVVKKDPSPPKDKKGKSKKDKSPSPSPDVKGKRGNKGDSSDKKEPVKKTKSSQNMVKVVTKGGAAVDQYVPNKDEMRVLIDGGKVYAATLNQANLDHNNNKFYIIQCLVNEKTGQNYTWNRWGRVGVPGQNALKPMPSKQAAINDYQSKRRDKTKGNYVEIEIKFDNDQQSDKKKQAPKSSSKPKKEVKSKMDQGLQKLMNLIFDVQVMNNTMKQIGYDAKKMPLGKLGDSTIKEAYTVLNQLTNAIKKGDQSQYNTLSSKFYTLIPHDFGFQKMSNFVLNNEEKIKQKIKMLETISDMKITTKLLDQKSDQDQSIHDQNYKKLGCDIKTVDEKSNDYKLLKEYLDNTKGNFSNVKVGEIYEVMRPTEQKAFNTKLGNNMLLWHGSRLANFVGILSQGLRIAPPEAPASGYLFGKGIYLADMAEKSINYCRSYGSDTALILLIEGALGDPNILSNYNSGAKEAMIKNKKDSTYFKGTRAPPEESYVNHKKMIVPHGKPKSDGYGSHSQFIVYNMNQARIRYLIRMDMKGS